MPRHVVNILMLASMAPFGVAFHPSSCFAGTGKLTQPTLCARASPRIFSPAMSVSGRDASPTATIPSWEVIEGSTSLLGAEPAAAPMLTLYRDNNGWYLCGGL